MRAILIYTMLFFTGLCSSQSISGVYKIADLTKRLENTDTVFVVNFWATWCKPCVEELPSFDSLAVLYKDRAVCILLVSLDFTEDLDKKVIPFLHKKQPKNPVVVLDEINGNEFVDRISHSWSGAIPATLIKRKTQEILLEKKIRVALISREIDRLLKE